MSFIRDKRTGWINHFSEEPAVNGTWLPTMQPFFLKADFLSMKRWGLRTIPPGVDQIQDIVHVGVTVSIAVAGVILTVCAQKQQDVIDVNG